MMMKIDSGNFYKMQDGSWNLTQFHFDKYLSNDSILDNQDFQDFFVTWNFKGILIGYKIST